jgi:hypothetical protein
MFALKEKKRDNVTAVSACWATVSMCTREHIKKINKACKYCNILFAVLNA